MTKRKASLSSSENNDDSKDELQNKKVKSLGHFTQGIVHDVRNALHVVLSSTHMIERRTDDPLILHHITSIEKTIERTNGLINRILAFADNRGDQLGVVDLSASIDESVSITLPIFPSSITIEWQRPHEQVHILGSCDQLYQVVSNLLKNAIQAIGDDEGTVLVSLSKSYPWAEIRVKDSGSGIAPEFIDQVCDASFTTKEDGNGFGLANVIDVVKKHGGTMQVLSPEGEGAEFIIVLPLLPELDV
ncbi:sensor protein ZraS [Mariprofundus micogutta]|uniref:histidine kinase n=1 Tax=Mariprofundus micogutta TaxID=1921010 RepID=A0A1L8CJI1_9PROT|nr:HAMP domain-containing sensor histidine kinase [Mariprofundus micogutta]GAV19082.1 sensor protein ZraS [Mariprofundus micogutta]